MLIVKLLSLLSEHFLKLADSCLVSQTLFALSLQLFLDGSYFALEGGLSSPMIINKARLVVYKLFKFLYHSLISTTFSSFFLDLIPQEADGLEILLLFFCVILNFPVELVRNFDLLV